MDRDTVKNWLLNHNFTSTTDNIYTCKYGTDDISIHLTDRKIKVLVIREDKVLAEISNTFIKNSFINEYNMLTGVGLVTPFMNENHEAYPPLWWTDELKSAYQDSSILKM